MSINNTGKKYTVIHDLPEFPLKKGDGGLYAILPYERLDRHGNALFKVGLADDFNKRFENYHTDYPLGFYYKNLLANPTKRSEDYKVNAVGKDGKRPSPEERENAKKSSKIKYYKKIEEHLWKDISGNGGERLRTTTRIKNSKINKDNLGDTEWFYTSPKVIDDAFNDAFRTYGGKEYSGHLNHINSNANRNRRNATYKAEIYYKII
jgi:hypothetical protein